MPQRFTTVSYETLLRDDQDGRERQKDDRHREVYHHSWFSVLDWATMYKSCPSSLPSMTLKLQICCRMTQLPCCNWHRTQSVTFNRYISGLWMPTQGEHCRLFWFSWLWSDVAFVILLLFAACRRHRCVGLVHAILLRPVVGIHKPRCFFFPVVYYRT